LTSSFADGVVHPSLDPTDPVNTNAFTAPMQPTQEESPSLFVIIRFLTLLLHSDIKLSSIALQLKRQHAAGSFTLKTNPLVHHLNTAAYGITLE